MTRTASTSAEGRGTESLSGEPAAGARSTRRALLLPAVCGLALAAFGLPIGVPGLRAAFLGAGAVLLAWTAGLYLRTRRSGRRLSIRVAIYKHHWVQACAQIAVLLYWGWYVHFVYAFIPLILAQIVFAYGVESLVKWGRGDTYRLGFGPFPVILSVNLFLWFRPEWFALQFAMIPLGYLGKEYIRWRRQGRSAHIFNPSSLPLAIFSLGLIVAGASGITFGQEIASSQFYPPHMYLVIFLAALPGEILFGVASMTLSAVITLAGISAAYLAVRGTFLFYDTWIPIAVFLGMHLLFTDPSTSPRSESGRILFGMLYGVGTAAIYALLESLGIPTFYDKLLPVPLMNLMVRNIDGLAASGRLALLDVSRLGRRLAGIPRNAAYTCAWAGAFLALSTVRVVGDDPAGQALPYWFGTCDGGNARACEYAARMTLAYCEDGSGWACNEWGLRQVADGKPADGAFRRACRLGFDPGCSNVGRAVADTTELARAAPRRADLPVVLRGTKPPLRGLSDDELGDRACRQGWREVCRRSGAAETTAGGR